jgi:hypothetical protein
VDSSSLDWAHKAERVRLSLEPLNFLETRTERELSDIYTTEEIWIYYDKLRSTLLAGVDIQRPTRIRPSVGAKKIMIWAYFSRSGIAHVVHPPPQDSFTRGLFVEKTLEDFDEALAHTGPNLRASRTFLRLDKSTTSIERSR